MSQTAQTERVTLSAALNDLGFFYGVFNTLVSGPSLLALFQMVFVEYRLVDALQWIVEGYNDITAVLGQMCEPVIAPVIAWINAAFDWRLDLHPHWRPLFILVTMFVMGWARMNWHAGARLSAVAFAATGTLGAFIGAAIAGLVPFSTDGRVEQGIVAAAPVFMVGLFVAAPLAATDRTREKLSWPILFGLDVALALAIAWIAWMAGTFWTMLVASGAGVLGLATTVVVMGALAFMMASGPNRYAHNALRLGIILLGGFATAALILAADALIKVLPDWPEALGI